MCKPNGSDVPDAFVVLWGLRATWMWGGIAGLIAGLLAGWMIDPELWPRFTNRQQVRFVALARLSTLLICFILNGDTTTCTQFFSLDCVFTPIAPCADPKVHRAPGGYPGDAKEEDGQREATASEATANLRSAGENCLAKAATSDMAVDESAEVAADEPAQDADPGAAAAGASDADASAPSDGTEPGVEDVSQFGEGLSEPSSKVVGLKQQCEQIWDAMHQNRIWRPMIFICIHALVPGNGDAFNSFTQGCARECTDPDTGELLPEFGFCERNEQDELIDVSVTLSIRRGPRLQSR